MEDRGQRAPANVSVDLVEQLHLPELLAVCSEQLGLLEHRQVPGHAVMTAEVHNPHHAARTEVSWVGGVIQGYTREYRGIQG